MVCVRYSWMLDGWSVGIGAKSSGDCQVASAPAKYWRGQKMRSCCSSWSAWWRTTWSPELPEKGGCCFKWSVWSLHWC